MKRLLATLGIGAGLMYFLDPNQGRSRRSKARDKAVHAGHAAGDFAGKASRDVRNRTRGVKRAVRTAFKHEDVDDGILRERVRAALGRAISHPGALDARVEDGRVILSGPVFMDEIKPLLRTVRHVRGVNKVEDRLEPHERWDRVPGLEGDGGRRFGPGFELRHRNWTPAVRAATMAGGGAIAAVGMRRHGRYRVPLGILGLGLAARGILNRPLTGNGRHRHQGETTEPAEYLEHQHV